MRSRRRQFHRSTLRSLGAIAVTGILSFAPAMAEDGDWNQWGGSPARNNTPESGPLPIDWDPGQFDAETGAWKPETSRNVAWVAQLGSQSYGNPVVAGGKAYVGTNNGKGWIGRYPASVDLGCLLAFNTNDGSFLWQDSSEKLPTGRVHDWPLQGICCSPYVEGDRLWYVTSRGEVKCLDTLP
jgi:outer membrane protein assembly factor BamB